MSNKQTTADKAIERLNLIAKICTRAESMGIRQGSRLTATMDVDFAADYFKMRLTDWLNADAFNFAHDFVGIQSHINRVKRTFDNRFLPRFAGKEDDKPVTNKADVIVEITADTRQIDGWVQGIAKYQNYTYEFCAKVFDEGSEYGINGGRVSKLGVKGRMMPIINYDRGWDLKPEDYYKPIYKALMKVLKALPKVAE